MLRIIVVTITVFIVACLVFDQLVQFRRDDAQLENIYTQSGIKARIGYYQSHGRTLRYVVSGDSTKATLLFLHGSPGSISYYNRRFQDTAITKRFRVIAVDRPGYGYSGLGEPIASIEDQAAMIRPLLDSLNHETHPLIIVGSSYGSSVACRIAMDYPGLVDGLVLTGPSLGPGLETTFWFTYIIENPLIRWFIPRVFRSANTEKVHHREELEKMLPLWKNIRVPVRYLQGAKDNIIDTTNAGFARKNLVNAPSLDIHFFPERQHLLAQYEWPTIRANIVTLYEQLKKK